tara:strand:+ start:238 stop:468 length:231 start_codon:yes stop_codon:yes gene_type:complete
MNVFSLSFDKTCRYLAGILTLPFESREYEYSPVKVFGLNVMLFLGKIPHYYPLSYSDKGLISIFIMNYLLLFKGIL